jgi:integrase
MVKTAVNWGKARFKQNQAVWDALRAIAKGLDEVELPAFTPKPPDISAIYMDEAATILGAARREADPRIRWLPWISAYTGLRINEVVHLRVEDFFESEGLWFFSAQTTGGRSLKTISSRRNVPVHPALVAEGLRTFVDRTGSGALFASGAYAAVTRWFHTLPNIHEGVSPNHGWRHLFEDLCYRYHVLEGARLYLAGRVTGKSDQMYGKTRARLPGLWHEMAKIEPFVLDRKPAAPAAVAGRP